MSEEQLINNPPPPVEVVTKEEWSAWVEHPTTKIFREFLRKQVEEGKDFWLGGKFTSPEGDQTLQMNARAIGTCQAYHNMLTLSAEDLNEGMRDD